MLNLLPPEYCSRISGTYMSKAQMEEHQAYCPQTNAKAAKNWNLSKLRTIAMNYMKLEDLMKEKWG